MTATTKQQNFINGLRVRKETAGTPFEGWEPVWEDSTVKLASEVIDYLVNLPDKADSIEEDVEPGIYIDIDSNLYRVYLGQKSGRALVKSVSVIGESDVEYTYLGSARRVVATDFRRLSLEEVGSLGRTFNTCLVCGRRLDDPESVDRGIGPICAGKY